jgi:hypothetical protein
MALEENAATESVARCAPRASFYAAANQITAVDGKRTALLHKDVAARAKTSATFKA